MNKILITLAFVFTSIAQAGSVESFNSVEVNTNGSTSNKVEASVHIISDLPLTDFGKKMAAREVIAITLNSFKSRELVSTGAIDLVKHQILKSLKENEVVGSVSVTDVFVTDLVVSSVGKINVNATLIPKDKSR